MFNKCLIDNESLLQEVRLCKQTGKISDWLAFMFLEIASTYVDRYSKDNSELREGLIANGVFQLTKSWDTFNSELFDNPLAYYKQAVACSVTHLLNKETRERKLRESVPIITTITEDEEAQ